MRFSLTTGLQIGLVIMLSVIGVYAFLASPFCSMLADSIMEFSPLHFLPFSFILFLLLLLLGLLLVLLEGKVGRFILLVLLFSLPSILPFSAVNWLQAFNLNFTLETRASLGQMLLLVLLISLGYLLLHYSRWLKEITLGLLNQGGEDEEVKEVYQKGHQWIFAIAGGAALAAGLVGALSLGLKHFISRYIEAVPLNIILVGVLCGLMLFIGLYLFILRSRSLIT